MRLDTETENEALLEWCKNVCRPELNIVDGLVANFVASFSDKPYAKKLLKVLKKMNEHLSGFVLSQLSANKFFPEALINYLETTELEDLSGDALILLVNIFDDQSVNSVSDTFTQKLIDSLPFVVDDSTADAILSIFTVLLPYYEKH